MPARVKPKTTVTTRAMPPLAVRAAFSPGSLNEERRTVDLVWTTGSRVLRQPWFGEDYYEELSLDPKHVDLTRLNSGAPLLNSHSSFDLGDVIGVVESARLEKGQGVATVRFAKAEDDAEIDAIFRKIKDGIIRNVSVGYRVQKMERVEDGDGEVPIMRATSWTPYEISMVPIGADAGAGVRSEGAETNPCEVSLVQERAMKVKKKGTPQRTSTPAPAARSEEAADAAEAGEGAEPGDEGSDEADDDEADDEAETETKPADEARSGGASLDVRAERARSAGIRHAGRAMRMTEKFVERHVEHGTSLEKFRELAVDVLQKRKPTVNVDGERLDSGEDARDKWLRGAGAWLVQKAGLSEKVAEAAKKRGEKVTLDPGEFRGMRLIDLARHSLERSGASTRGMMPMELAGKAFMHRAGGYQTTSDFGTLLAGTINQVLLAAYATAPDTWRLFAKAGSVSDFRPHSRLRQGTFSRLDKVNEHGEFKNKAIPDGAAEPISAKTYGNIVGVTRQVIVNDDLGFLSDLSARLGRAAKLSIELMVYDLLAENSGLGPTMADGYTLFHASHGNIATGAALGVAGLDTDRLKMAVQTDPSGNEYLDIRPKVLLLPVGLEGQARVTLEAEFDVDEADGTTPNRIRGLFPTIVGSPRISGTRRYIFADPNDVTTLEVVFLDGQQEPFLDQQEGWRIDGTEWKVRLDVGAGAVDWRGAVTNAGV